MLNPLIYASTNGQIVVLDLPSSISWAQETESQLLSVEAVRRPYKTPEPKGDKLLKIRDATPLDDRRYRKNVEAAIDVALTEARESPSRTRWYFPRAISDDSFSTTNSADPRRSHLTVRHMSPSLILSPGINQISHSEMVQCSGVHNPNNVTVDVLAVDLGCFHVPSGSTFVMASINDGFEGFQTATQMLQPRGLNSECGHLMFDLILLDPPWGNRSVRKSKAYRSAEDQESDPFRDTLPIIESYLATGGYVAIWTTNKIKVRTEVLNALMALGLDLIEEWIWVKVTAVGEPVMPLDGHWRKPYEVLLLFRSCPPASCFKRKILIAVPDIHSRKPSLKCLFDGMFPGRYQALELFARSLTSQWWSWGDEVLKFQHESCWLAPTSDNHQ